MTAAEALAALKAHLAKRGFEDIEVNMTGGYDPNSTAADAGLIRAQTAVYRRGGGGPVVLPRNPGARAGRSEEDTAETQPPCKLLYRLLPQKKKEHGISC